MILEYKKLEEVSDVIMGQSPSGETYNNKGLGLPFYQGKAEFGDMHPTPIKWCNSPIKIAKKNDILISVRAPVGATNIASETCCIGRGLAAIRNIPDLIDRDYLWCFLQASEANLIGKGQGSTFESINSTDLCTFAIPVYDIKVQRQISTRLKFQLAEVETARKALEKQDQEIVNLANAYIRQSIEKSKATEQRLGDVLEEVKKGIGETWKEYPVLGATRSGLAPAKEPPGKYPHRYKPVFNGTVFYNPMRIMIGSIAFVDNEDKSGITSPDYVALKGKEKQVDSRWFYYWLRSPYGEHCINSLARGAVRERMLFNRLAEGVIQLPSYQEQCQVSKSLSALRPIKNAIQQQLDDLNKIPQRILAQIFNTPTQ